MFNLIQLFENRNKEKWIRFCMFFIFLVLVVEIMPYVYTIFYAIPQADDFSMAVQDANVFVAAVRKANSMYMNWDGRWLYFFFETLLNPLNFAGGEKILGIELIFFLGFLLASIYYLFRVLYREVYGGTDELYKLYYIVLIGCVLNIRIYEEVFYWFVGSVYLWAVAFAILTVTLLFKFYKNQTIGVMVALTILGCMACSFYMLAVVPLAVYFWLEVHEFIRSRKLSIRRLIPGILFIISALVSVAAPGNFARHATEAMDSDLKWVDSFLVSITVILKEIFALSKNPVFVLTMIAFILFGCFAEKRTVKFSRFFVMCITTLAVIFVICFPVVLGYSSLGLPYRVYFCLDVVMILFSAADAFYLGLFFSSKGWVCFDLKQSIVMFILLFYFSMFIGEGINETPYMLTCMQAGNIKESSRKWKDILSEIEHSEDEDVVVYSQKFETPIIKTPGFTEDTDYWVNVVVAKYYGKKSIRFQWIE